jgi:hypothetical protein
VNGAGRLTVHRDRWVICHGVGTDFTPARWLCAVRRCPPFSLAEGQVAALDAPDEDALADLLDGQALIDHRVEHARVFPPTAKPLLSGPADDNPS